ncbi:MAG: MBL fold metallo-hydrolase [Pirellulales bacterium]|nr:MBL fold metallo-hydrolase [Pirellulales bacterium]
MFHYDRGLFLTAPGVAVDIPRRQPCGFISHAHRDHMGRHEFALATPETLQLYRYIFPGRRPAQEMPYGKTIEWNGARLTAHPAGHCLGSAMLLAEIDGTRLLYTGDYKLGPSATCECAELPNADILIMECTFGNPRRPRVPREAAIDQLLDRVRATLQRGATPVIYAYPLGKSQEVTRILTSNGFGVVQNRKAYAISEIYKACGVELGHIERLDARRLPGHAVILPPQKHVSSTPLAKRKVETFAVTGWAAFPEAESRLGVDHAIPLSDHADYDELLSTVHRVQPEEVYCTHGPKSFAKELTAAGFRAAPLTAQRQLWLV